MHIKQIKTRQAWTAEQEIQLISVYFNMLHKQENNEKFVKSHIVAGLAEKQNRSRGSIEAKFMNISAIADKHGFKIVKGYKALANYGKSLEVNFSQFVQMHLNHKIDYKLIKSA